ncbi:MAG: DUF4738 domain-containing protein [Prevotella sp.]|nr:DUF4738 domain-containing protein [Prevotella sp.]
MKNKLIVFACGVLALTLVSCAEKKKDTTIITHRVVKKPSTEIKTVGDYNEKQEVQWVGSTYTVVLNLQADKTLPTVAEGNQKYYDNSVVVKVVRQDGSEFFSKTFKKTDFTAYIDTKTADNGVLLGIVFNRVEENHLCFSASVGSPDMLSDAYVPLMLKISRFGEVSISKDTLMERLDDTSTTDEVEDEDLAV